MATKQTMDDMFFDSVIMQGLGLNTNELSPEKLDQVKKIAHYLLEWSKEVENTEELDSDLPSYSDLAESFENGSIDTLYMQAQQARVAVSEMDTKILSHIRAILSVASTLKDYNDDPADDSSIPDFLKVLPVDLREYAIREMLMTEVAAIAGGLMEYDIRHSKNKTEEEVLRY